MENFDTSGFVAEFPAGKFGEHWVRSWLYAMQQVAKQMGLRITGASLMPDAKASRRIWLHCVPAGE